MDIAQTVQAVWKLESARIIAGLTRLVHDVGRAEDFAQDALLAALEQWPRAGVPDNPAAWLMTTAKRRAIDDIRRAGRLEQRRARLTAAETAAKAAADAAEPAGDDVLRLMFLTCHPLLPMTERVALTLRLVAGLTAAEIARAFLTHETQINQRIATAKRRLAEAGVSLQESTVDDRLPSVLGVVYLIFNEGYSATAGEDLIRADLCREALRLGRMLAELAPHEPEVHGLVALMEIQASRTAARTGPSGEPVPLEEQDRARWDPLLIRRGFAAMLRARDLGGPPGPHRRGPPGVRAGGRAHGQRDRAGVPTPPGHRATGQRTGRPDPRGRGPAVPRPGRPGHGHPALVRADPAPARSRPRRTVAARRGHPGPYRPGVRGRVGSGGRENVEPAPLGRTLVRRLGRAQRPRHRARPAPGGGWRHRVNRACRAGGPVAPGPAPAGANPMAAAARVGRPGHDRPGTQRREPRPGRPARSCRPALGHLAFADGRPAARADRRP